MKQATHESGDSMTGNQTSIWPYARSYEKETETGCDVLVLGGGIAGCWAAIAAARKGAKVVLVEKAATVRSGDGGAGVDHWQGAVTNPACRISPEEFTQALIDNYGGYRCGITTYIKCREAYDCLLELEKMGVKIRDSEDEFKGAPFRDEKTKLLFSYDYENRYTLRVWGSAVKPALYRECKRLGVTIFDRVMVTSLLNEKGRQGAKVVGAVGFDVRTGAFLVFKGKSTVLCMSAPYRIWPFSGEIAALESSSGDGHAIAWRAGALFGAMEGSGPRTPAGYPPYGVGSADTVWYGCNIVDAHGKEIPWVDRDGHILKEYSDRFRPPPGQRLFIIGGSMGASRRIAPYDYRSPTLAATEGYGKFTRPFYADLPSMPGHERRAIFGLMVAQEVKTLIPVYWTYTRAGFDPDKDMLQVYESGDDSRSRRFDGGGLVVDWDLKTSLDGLYAAGRQVFGHGAHAGAAATGRYAGRHAARYAIGAKEPAIDRKQVEVEKTRIYAPLQRKKGTGWKELHDGVCKIIQEYCGEQKNEELLTIGLQWLHELETGEAAQTCATNPHELMHTLRVHNMITMGKMMMEASRARRASNQYLGLTRTDCADADPNQWHKWLTLRFNGENVTTGELPLDYYGDLVGNYTAHCSL
jgi:succinate dehydrogenase/fumarate reductase flavoprotein subunit